MAQTEKYVLNMGPQHPSTHGVLQVQVELDGETVFNIGAEEFSDYMVQLAEHGASILGGCCGTTPEFIKKTIEKTQYMPYECPIYKDITMVSSYTHAVIVDKEPILIGERINPTGKPKLKEALRTGDLNYVLNEAVRQADKNVHILDVNVGLPEIDETDMMRIYNGKPLVNSVNGTEESMKNVLPIVQKYG